MKKLFATFVALCLFIIPSVAVSADDEKFEVFDSANDTMTMTVVSDHDILVVDSPSVTVTPDLDRLLDIEKDIYIRQEKSGLENAKIKVEVDEAYPCVHMFVYTSDDTALNDAIKAFVHDVKYVYAEEVQVHVNEVADPAVLERLLAIEKDICARFEKANLDTTIGTMIDAENELVLLYVDMETEDEKLNDAVGALAKGIQLDYEGEVEVLQHEFVVIQDTALVANLYKTVLPTVGKQDLLGVETTGMTLYSYNKPSNTPTVLISLSILMIIALGCFLFFKNRQTSQASVTNTGHVVSTGTDLSKKAIEDSIRKSEIKPSAAFDKKMRDMIDDMSEK